MFQHHTIKTGMFLGLFLLWGTVCSGLPTLRSESVDNRNGLPSNRVNDMVQDKTGFIWMGTANGLCRFDGYALVRFPWVGPENEKVEANIGTMFCDEKNGLLWLRTATFNYACYDLEKGKFVDFTEKGQDAHKSFSRFAPEADGLWMYEENAGTRHVTYKEGRFSCKDYDLAGRKLRRLLPDGQGNGWALTNRGLLRIDKQGKTDDIVKTGDFVVGNHWQDRWFFLTSDGWTWVFDRQGKLLKKTCIPAAYDGWSEVSGNFVWQDKWAIMTRGGVFFMDCRDFSFTHPAEMQMKHGVLLDSIEGCYWVSDRDGRLWTFPKQGAAKAFSLLQGKGYSVSRKRRFSTTMGKDGLYYIATYGNGLFVYSPKDGFLEHHKADDEQALLASNYLTDIMADASGCVWVSQEEAGVVRLGEEEAASISYLMPEPGKRGELSNYITGLARLANGKGNSIRVNTRSHQVYEVDTESGSVRLAEEAPYYDERTDSTTDGKGRTWIATWEKGLLVRRKGPNGKQEQQQFLTRHITESRINALVIDTEARLWVATYDGVYMVDTRKDHISANDFRHYTTADGLPTNNIACLLAATDGSLWMGGQGTGAVRCKADKDGKLTVDMVTTRQGLPDNNVHSMTEDLEGNIWTGAEGTIACISPQSMRAKGERVGTSLLSSLCSDGCALTLADGRLLFGTHDGIAVVTPAPNMKAMPQQTAHRAWITDIDVNGTSVCGNSQYDILPIHGQRFSLPHDGNSLTFYFSTFNYAHQDHVMFQYYLEGMDTEWREPTTQHKADFQNLQPGAYVLHLRTADNETETTLPFTIRQPWWNTWWAWLAYLCAAVAIGWYVERNWRERFRLQQEMKMAKQLAEFRIDFFTQVAHEFRTPLAIISGAVDKMAESGSTPKKPTLTAKRGVKRLTQLVNRLMEFRKMDSGNLKLNVEQGDVVALVREIYQDFWNTAQQKRQTLTFIPFDKNFEMPFDRHIVDSIVYNLLSNAVKYTPEKGSIALRLALQSDQLCIEVEDSGPGIDPAREKQLFQPFMHGLASQGGMGIGLYTARKMAQVHKGSLAYERSGTMGGSKFTLRLPADDRVYNADDYLTTVTTTHHKQEDSQTEEILKEMLPQALNNYHVALIEDDPDMMEQIKSEMGIYFNVDAYTTGNAGFEGIKSAPPSLIICDVMLPDMNGYDIVRQLKANAATQPIPVIMLTALDDESHQIKGYEAGADDYMVKPCNYRILMARIAQLIKWKETREQTSDNERPPLAEPQQVLTNQADKRTLEKIRLIIQQHIADPDFTIDQMAELMKMGRTKLFGITKTLTGMTPNKLLSAERMKKAAELLEEGELNISEISWKVGIQDASYFNKCFKQHFGMSPSQYRKES